MSVPFCQVPPSEHPCPRVCGVTHRCPEPLLGRHSFSGEEDRATPRLAQRAWLLGCSCLLGVKEEEEGALGASGAGSAVSIQALWPLQKAASPECFRVAESSCRFKDRRGPGPLLGRAAATAWPLSSLTSKPVPAGPAELLCELVIGIGFPHPLLLGSVGKMSPGWPRGSQNEV